VRQAKKTLKTIKSADELTASLLALSEKEQVCLLDSCGVKNLGSRFLFAGINPIETYELTNENPFETLRFLDRKLSSDNLFSIFTISYEFGLKLEKIKPRVKSHEDFIEPDVFLAIFDCFIVHDYRTRETFLLGNERRFDEIESKLESASDVSLIRNFQLNETIRVTSNFSKAEYVVNIEKIKERIRCGDTYQTNLTQQIRAVLPEQTTPQKIFWNLRKNHPAPFAAFLQRSDSTVISASPERFFKVQSSLVIQSPKFKVQSLSEVQDLKTKDQRPKTQNRKLIITASPIKGTRPRGKNPKEDLKLQNELRRSEKDRAENVMIVDLLRNDLGKICEFGSVRVEKLCDLETHSTLFHLVSTINGELRENTKFSEILRALFPCGSITGAPKISTMRIIDELESVPRGLSMGAIGYAVRNLLEVQSIGSKVQNQREEPQRSKVKGQGFLEDQRSKIEGQDLETETYQLLFNASRFLDLSVAIRTLVIRNQKVVFNVGGGIVIDSNAEAEYEETLVKAKALLNSFGGKL
jgi:para-aminobenzoate synthetase component 1